MVRPTDTKIPYKLQTPYRSLGNLFQFSIQTEMILDESEHAEVTIT